MTKKQMLKKIPLYLIAVIFIIFNYTCFYQFLGVVSKDATTIVPFCIIVPFFIYLLIFKRTIDYRSLTVAMVLICNVLLSTVLAKDMAAEIYMISASIFIAFVVSNLLERQQFIDCYVNVILAFSIASIITTYIILPLDVENGLGIFPLVRVGETYYFNMYTTLVRQAFGIARNSGIGREPGVFQIYLLFAIYFVIEHQKESKANIYKAVFLIIVMLSTFSAICYITAPVCVLMLMRKYIKNPKTFVKTVFITAAAVLVFAVFVISNESIMNEFSRTANKWDGDAQGNSFDVRYFGVFSNVELYLEKPLFGHGLITSWLEVIARSGYDSVTGTTLIGFAAFGTVFGFLIHYVLYKMCRVKTYLVTFVWFFTILFSTLSQNLIVSHVFWILLFSGFMKESTKPELQKPVETEPTEQEQPDGESENENESEEIPLEMQQALRIDIFDNLEDVSKTVE